MNKILRISVMSLFMLCIGTFTWANDITLDFNTLSITKNEAGFTLVSNGITLTATKEIGKTTPTQNAKQKDLRLYAKNKLKVEGEGFKQIVFNISPYGMKRWCDVQPSVGTMTPDVTAKTITWTNTDAVTEVSFTVGDKITLGTDKGKAGQFDFISMVVSTESGVTPPPTPTPTIETVDNIAAFKALSDGTTAQLKLNNAQVLYTWTTNNGNTSTYIHDATGALLLYNSGLTLEENKMLNGEVTLKLTDYNGLPEGVKTDKTNADGLTITDGTPAKPKVITPDKASENLSDLVQVEGVTIQSEPSEKRTNYYAHVGDQKIQLFNGFHLDAYNDLSPFNGVQNQTVKGIVSLYKGQPQINIINIEKTMVSDNINQLNSAINDNAPMYNLAGQRVGKEYKGVVIQNGKKFINR